MKVPVGISKRHVHLAKKTYKQLFGAGSLEVRNYLKQPGQFASTGTVDLKWNDKIIEHVRIVGPLRRYNQVELSSTEADFFGINPPRRKSGDLKGSLPITIVGALGEVTINEGVILAENHVHFSPQLAKELNLKDKETIKVVKGGEPVLDAKVKIEKNAVLELHIDTDEEKAYDLHQDEEVEVYKCGK